MRTHALRLFLAVGVLLGAAALGADARQLPGSADNLAPHQHALDALAGYTAGTAVDHADVALKRIGYSPFVPPAEWMRYPAERKLCVAYLAAVAADPVQGGEKYLALLSHNLARLWDPVAQEPALAPYLAKTAPPSVAFRRPAAAQLPLPRQVDAALTTLADFYSGGAGSARQVLVRHFKMADHEAVTLLRTSASNQDAFRRAAASVDPASRTAALRTWTAEASSRYDAVAHEPALQPFLPPAPGAPPPSARPVVPRAPTGPGAVSRYRSVMRELPVRSFRVVSRVRIGPGGVVFGNTVTAAVTARPATMRFVPGPAGVGSFEVVLHDGTRLVHRDVPAELALVAHRIATGADEPLAADNAIGLVGILDNTPEVSCSPATLSLSSAQRFHTAINPALVDREIGWAALMVDSLPIRERQLLDLVRTTQGGASAAALRALLTSAVPAGFTNEGTWKVVDVPIVLTAENGALIAARSGGPASLSDGVRRSAFLEMRRILLPAKAGADEIADAAYDKPFAATFYAMVPLLTRASADYRYLNQFARVLAVARWAVLDGARFDAPPQTTPVPTPDALLVSDRTIRPIAAFDRLAVVEKNIERLKMCQAQVETDPSVRAFVATLKAASPDRLGSLLEAGSRRPGNVGFWCRVFGEYLESRALQLAASAPSRSGR